MNFLFIHCLVLLVLLVMCNDNVLGQNNPLKVYPLYQINQNNQNNQNNTDNAFNSPSSKNKKNGRSEVLPPIPLPFWDDFSKTNDDKQPLIDFWATNTGVLVEEGIGINAPSLNVATFDGAKLDGSSGVEQQVSTRSDVLTSRCLDLSLVSEAERNSIYLSFFYQFKGRGEQPDATDKLVLEFKNNEKAWIKVWEIDIATTPTISSEEFKQVIIHVSPSRNFVHAEFQFQFANYNRNNGNFDTWHIDYVYMNKNRNATDLLYKDRTVSNWTNGLFKNYTAVPFNQFQSPNFDLENELVESRIEINNLGDDLVTSVYTSYLADKKTPDTPLVPLVNKKSFGTLLQGSERRVFVVEPTSAATLRAAVTQPMSLEHIFFFDKVDLGLIRETVNGVPVYYDHIDYTKNDRISRTYDIQDYFAYDDGTAEFGAGINQTGGQLLVEFDIPIADEITAVDLYIPSITKNFTAVPIDITIRTALDNKPEHLLYQEPVTITKPTKKNEFLRFWLYRAIPVEGKIYVGITQFSDINLAIGLDKNRDTSARIHYNVLGTWEQNESVKGALMLRPVLGERKVITGVDNEIINQNNSLFYPNPVQNSITFRTAVSQINIYSLSGEKQLTFPNATQRINLSTLKKGNYIIKYILNGQVTTNRLIKE